MIQNIKLIVYCYRYVKLFFVETLWDFVMIIKLQYLLVYFFMVNIGKYEKYIISYFNLHPKQFVYQFMYINYVDFHFTQKAIAIEQVYDIIIAI